MATVRNLAQYGNFDGTDAPRGTSLRDVTGQGIVTIVPNDAAVLPQFIRKLIVGVTGTVHYLDNEGVDRTVTLPVGTFECVMTKIFATGTTATTMLGVI